MTDDADPENGKQPVAFISHHSSQYETAKHLKDVLERNGVTGWLAPDDIDPGVPFDQAIMQQVERSDLIVLLFCAQSDQSRHVKREIMLADEGGKLLYPVRLEDIDAKGLAYWLKDYQWIDWIDRRDETISRLVETVKKQVAGPAMNGENPPVPTEKQTIAPLPSAATDGGSSGSWREGLFGRPLWLAGGAIALVALFAAGFFFMANDDPDPNADSIRPGQWQTTNRMANVIEQGTMTDAQLRQFQSEFENETVTQCVTLQQARLPLTDMFDPGGSNGCVASGLRMDDGEINATFYCRPQSSGGAPFAVWLVGTYDRETMNMRAEYAYFRDTPQEVRFVVEQTGHHLGDCN